MAEAFQAFGWEPRTRTGVWEEVLKRLLWILFAPELERETAGPVEANLFWTIVFAWELKRERPVIGGAEEELDGEVCVLMLFPEMVLLLEFRKMTEV